MGKDSDKRPRLENIDVLAMLYEGVKSELAKVEAERDQAIADVAGLERFRDLRTRHNDEMQLRTSQLAKAETERDELARELKAVRAWAWRWKRLAAGLRLERDGYRDDVCGARFATGYAEHERDELKAENDRLRWKLTLIKSECGRALGKEPTK